MTRLKRYQIDRIFHTGTQRSPKEAWEADFDVVFSSSPPPTAAVHSVSASSRGSTQIAFQKGLYDGKGGSIGGGGMSTAGAFEMAEAEVVLVVSQVRRGLAIFFERIKKYNSYVTHAEKWGDD